MREHILTALSGLERELGYRPLYACESGSRAWGFASPDSDWDVRLIYVMPANWYFKVLEQPDQFERALPGDLDIAGWELRKTLRLFASCNLALNEWLLSPEVYQDLDGLSTNLRGLIPAFFNPRKAIHHYRSIASNAWQTLDEDGRIGIKKIFYALRPLFAAWWIVREHSMPPTVFQQMLGRQLSPADVEHEIIDLTEQKESAPEGYKIVPPRAIMAWIQDGLNALAAMGETIPAVADRPYEALDALMLQYAFRVTM